jgi:hypothetical protein
MKLNLEHTLAPPHLVFHPIHRADTGGVVIYGMALVLISTVVMDHRSSVIPSRPNLFMFSIIVLGDSGIAEALAVICPHLGIHTYFCIMTLI